MINTKLTRKAMIIAYNAHIGQVDKAFVPYIYHPIHVAEQMEDEVTCIAALLHDVVEDTEVTFTDLEKEFPKETIDILRLLTHDKNTDYMEYIEKIKSNKSRLDEVDEKALIREEKYKKALKVLEETF